MRSHVMEHQKASRPHQVPSTLHSRHLTHCYCGFVRWRLCNVNNDTFLLIRWPIHPCVIRWKIPLWLSFDMWRGMMGAKLNPRSLIFWFLPFFPMCSHYVLNELSNSQRVPKFPKCFQMHSPKIFPIAPGCNCVWYILIRSWVRSQLFQLLVVSFLGIFVCSQSDNHPLKMQKKVMNHAWVGRFGQIWLKPDTNRVQIFSHLFIFLAGVFFPFFSPSLTSGNQKPSKSLH